MSKKKRLLKRLSVVFAAFLVLCLLGTFYLFAVNKYVSYYSKDYILTNENAAELLDVDCILVLGAGIWGDSLSPLLEDRMLTGIALYKDGVSNRLLVSGDHGSDDYDEVNAMKEFAVKNGVKADEIFMDHAGFSTYESMYRARDVFEAEKIVIVTQKYHLYRAIYNARKLGLEAFGVSSDLRSYGSYTNTYNNSREFLARNKDFLWCILKPNPTYLGESIPISGSGTATDDKVY
ncbi:MAG TPA: ElyC/SanA/YdcF family protein [Oscillospiraceae bacterium]|nr:ElyC/SanA/YdcF family protein [Oscillospiraceae bacterium]